MWNMIRTDEDIAELKQSFGEFKNSCVCEIKYRSGAFVGSSCEHFINDELSLSVILQRKSLGDVRTVELRFSGLRALRLMPLGKGMECYLTAATLRLKNGAVTFSTWDDLDPMNADAGVLLITADMLMWRDISDIMQYTA